MPLEHLYINDNHIRDLSPLRGVRLKRLECQGNELTALEPLSIAVLEYLNCSRNPIATLAPFLDNPPACFLFDCDSLPDSELETAAARWSAHTASANAAQHARILLACRRKDWKTLRKYGSVFNGHTYLFVPKDITWEEANRLCCQFGGHLVTVTSVEEMNFVCSVVMKDLVNDIYPWIGLEATAQGPRWITGEEYVFDAPYQLLGWETGGKARLLGQTTKKWFTNISPAYKSEKPIVWTSTFIIEWES
jgi:Leucine-rich repeat (LRR) protein